MLVALTTNAGGATQQDRMFGSSFRVVRLLCFLVLSPINAAPTAGEATSQDLQPTSLMAIYKRMRGPSRSCQSRRVLSAQARWNRVGLRETLYID